MKPTIFWDFDGTLGYREGMWSATLLALAEEGGVMQLSLTEIRALMKGVWTWDYWQKAHREILENSWWGFVLGNMAGVLIKLGVDPQKAFSIVNRFPERYISPEYWRLYPDTLATLEKSLSLGYQNVMITNHVPELPQIVHNLGVRRYFKRIVVSSLVGYDKPHPEIYRLAQSETDGNCVMVGDNYQADIAGANALNIPAVLVRVPNEEGYPFYLPDLNGIFEVLEQVKKEASKN